MAEHASQRFGGEALLPLQYFRRLRARGVEAWLVVHERTRDELVELLGEDICRVRFVSDRPLQQVSSRLNERTGYSHFTLPLGMTAHLVTQLDLRRAVRTLIREVAATVVHEPMPVSPKAPSLMHGLGVPVIIGPMNGGMSAPAGFSIESDLERRFVGVARALAGVVHLALPGKRRAHTLLVANERTRRALPRGAAPRVLEVVENGVDMELFTARDRSGAPQDGPLKLLFLGRLVPLKGANLLLDALARVRTVAPVELVIVGDGPERAALEEHSARIGLSDTVRFRGFLPVEGCADELHRADALVLPSLMEAGGAVVLEAMASGVPVIATRWGGPADYLDDTTGVLIDPHNPEQFIEDLALAIIRFAREPQLRRRLAVAGYERAVERFDWEKKIDTMLALYTDASGLRASDAVPTATPIGRQIETALLADASR